MKTNQPLSGILYGNITLFMVQADHHHSVGLNDPSTPKISEIVTQDTYSGRFLLGLLGLIIELINNLVRYYSTP